MKLKKLLTLALAGVMALALLTGCSKHGMTAEEKAVAEGVAAKMRTMQGYEDVILTVEDVPEAKRFADLFKPSWIKANDKLLDIGVTDKKVIEDMMKKYPSTYTNFKLLDITDGKSVEQQAAALGEIDYGDGGFYYYVTTTGPQSSYKTLSAKICATTIKSEGKTYRLLLMVVEYDTRT